MRKITANIFQINGAWGSAEILGGNVFLLKDHKLTLVDAGYKGSASRILKAVRTLGYSPHDIENIILTHHHPDHISGLAALKRLVPAKVMVHRDDAPYINGLLSQPGPAHPGWLKFACNPIRRLWATPPIEVDLNLQDGDELAILGGIRVVHTPGHTPGSIILHIPDQKVIITGDLLIHGEKLGLPSREFTVNILQEFNSIRKVAKLDFDIACFGHGPPIMREAKFQLKTFAESLRLKYQIAFP
jgi:glyoxylase-like metal-dependent hydrolase (beta-lactamase superfamily II)